MVAHLCRDEKTCIGFVSHTRLDKVRFFLLHFNEQINFLLLFLESNGLELNPVKEAHVSDVSLPLQQLNERKGSPWWHVEFLLKDLLLGPKIAGVVDVPHFNLLTFIDAVHDLNLRGTLTGRDFPFDFDMGVPLFRNQGRQCVLITLNHVFSKWFPLFQHDDSIGLFF